MSLVTTPPPLGAHWNGTGVTFAVWSAGAISVELCLFDHADAQTESRRIPLTTRTGDIWHTSVHGIGPGQLYGFRVHGPWSPSDGHRFDASKVLTDPYARALGRPLRWHPSLCSAPTIDDSAPYAPLSAVVDPSFDWGADRPPRTAWTDTILYEAHVKGFTARHPAIPPADRGTYRGLGSAAAIEHLRQLGVTALELLPVHARVDELPLHQRGLTNYWGYNTHGFFAPEPRLGASTSPTDVVREFKSMVKALHEADIEVILDVVYNHTAEGDDRGPTTAFRGLDNAAYYRLQPDDLSRYEDFTGCGNTLDTREPVVRNLIIDSLRYWVDHMHVDGFRFDLTSALVRGDHGVDRHAPLLTAIAADPVLSRVKLIAEPWDATGEGYALGGFPQGWSEWNGQFRDTMRRVWRGDSGLRGLCATRLAGSSDVFGTGARPPTASINFITAHDGFTLADLVAYAHKHNHANGEDNRDGPSQTFSHNWGVEGPTSDPSVLEQRARIQRSLLLSLIASMGVPMISGGDELGRSQQGNNNAYCHDNALSWTPWTEADGADPALLDFTRRLVELRGSHAVLRRSTFLSGAPKAADVTWIDDAGEPLADTGWHDSQAASLGMWLHGQDQESADVLILLNPGAHHTSFAVPGESLTWTLALTSYAPRDPARPLDDGRSIVVPAGGAAILTGSSGAESTRP